MRELLQLGELLDKANNCRTPDETRAVLVLLIQHLYRKEHDREKQEWSRTR